MIKDERFETIFRTCYARVWRFFRANRVSDDESHDLAQNTFKRLLEYKDDIRNEDPWPLLQQIARSVLLNHIRDGKTLKRTMKLVDIDDPDFNEEPAAPEGPDLAEREQSAIQKRRLEEEIEKLPEGQRQAIQLRLKGLEYQEIADVLHITLDAVRSRLRDAKRLLRARLGDGNALPEDDE